LIDDLLMSEMHTIKGANCQNGTWD
jgi:hypothetical protein